MTVTQLHRAAEEKTMTEQSEKRSAKTVGTRDKTVLFCEQCYRYDKHIPVKIGPVFRILVVIGTLGLALIFWPKRCSCCGSLRF
jgi:hypothetical protein